MLAALNPVRVVDFFVEYEWRGFWALGSIFLVVTGGEALYADMGHLGRGLIRISWFSLVLPALTLNYLGQGALLLREQAAIRNPFFLLGPGWAISGILTILATVATVIRLASTHLRRVLADNTGECGWTTCRVAR